MNTGQIRFGNENSSLGLEINMKSYFSSEITFIAKRGWVPIILCKNEYAQIFMMLSN